MTVHLFIGILLVAAGVGFLSGSFGTGGSALATPLLHVLGIPALIAVASPLPATIPATWLASRPYARAGHVDRRVLRYGVLIGLPATVLGALCTTLIPGNFLIIASEIVVLGLGLRILLTRTAPDISPDEPAASRARIVAVVAAVGIISGLLGNSGGFLLAPLFIAVLRMPMRRALGTSLALATMLAVPGTITHAALGHIDWAVTGVLALGAAPMAMVGARAALQLRERALVLSYGLGLTALAGGLLAFAR